jgi:TRAP-type C4-dicarboxylate transport system permease small subunit
VSDIENGAEPALARLDSVIRPLSLYLGGIVLACMAVLTVVQVGFRYLLNDPITGADDIAQLFLIAVVAFSVAQSGRTGGQVVVELLGAVTGPKFTRWTDILVKIMGLVMIIILSVQLIENGFSAADYGEASGTLLIPFGPFFWLLSFGMILYGAVLLIETFVHIRGGHVSHRSETLAED